MTTFQQLGIKNTILDGLKEMGFSETFPIQEAAIPALLIGRDVVGQAHTGSGKTAAFVLPMLQNITPKKGIEHSYAMHFATNVLIVISLFFSFLS